MKALWLENRTLRLADVAKPDAAPGEALIQVKKAGICATDEALLQGLYSYTGIMGHEFVGAVEDGPAHLLGRRVVGEINLPCGQCVHCANGLHKHCHARRALGIRDKHGAFARWLTLPCENLHVVPDDVPDDAAVFTEPLAAAFDVLARVAPLANKRVLVVGTGKLGQLVTRVLAQSAGDLHALGRNSKSIARLPKDVIAHHNHTSALTQSYDVVVDCAGTGQAMQFALDCVKPGGQLVIKSTPPGLTSVDLSYVVVNEITLVGSRCGPFPEALEFLTRRHADVASLVDARFRIDDALRAMQAASSPGQLKVLLEFV